MTTIPFMAMRRVRAAAKAAPPKLSAAKDLLQFLFYLTLIVFAILHYGDFGAFVQRVARGATQVSLAGATFTIPGPQGSEATSEWTAVYRLRDRLELRKASLSETPAEGEFVEVCASAPVNLQGGFIGDSKKMRYLRNGPVLGRNECARLYTALPKPNGAAVALLWDGTKWTETADGMFKSDRGEGDRIIVIDARRDIVLDVEFWWTGSPPA